MAMDRSALFEENREWAATIARNFARRKLPLSFDPQDLEQEARIACWKRSEVYDETRGVPFQAYAYLYVINAVKMAVRRRHWAEAVMPELDPASPDSRPVGEEAIELHRDQAAAERCTEKQRAMVAGVLDSLPESEKAVVSAALDGADFAELERAWGQDGSARRKLGAACRKLRKKLAPAVAAVEPAPQASTAVHRDYRGADVVELLRGRFGRAAVEAVAIDEPVAPVAQEAAAPAPAAAVVNPAREEFSGGMIMNEHYAAVLADLQQMKSDAENGIRALQRLMSRDSANGPHAIAPVRAHGNGAELSGASRRVIEFLEANPATSYTLAEVARGIDQADLPRATLARLAASGRISKAAPGRFHAVARPQTQQPQSAAEVVA